MLHAPTMTASMRGPSINRGNWVSDSGRVRYGLRFDGLDRVKVIGSRHWAGFKELGLGLGLAD